MENVFAEEEILTKLTKTKIRGLSLRASYAD
jgi:hypothetical protein